VAYGALGTPIVGLTAVTGYSEFVLGRRRAELCLFRSPGAVLVDLGLREIFRDALKSTFDEASEPIRATLSQPSKRAEGVKIFGGAKAKP
jgi:hypothetical protein